MEEKKKKVYSDEEIKETLERGRRLVAEAQAALDEILAKFRHAREVMLAGGECPMRRANIYDVLEALAALGTLIPTAVGPHRKDKRSPAALVAQFAGVPEEAVSPALHVRSRERAQEITDMLHGALADAGHPVTGLTFQDHLRATGRT